MQEIRDRITTSVRFNTVLQTGVPGSIARARRADSATQSRRGERGGLHICHVIDDLGLQRRS